MNLLDLGRSGFDIQTVNHAQAILEEDFSVQLDEICDALLELRIPGWELIQGGGGEAASTQRLRRMLNERRWLKHRFVISKIVDGDEKSSVGHEIDHVRTGDSGTIALEIEWNNKDPFFDRDLENFQRLHAEGIISVGVVITRGMSLQQNLRPIVEQVISSLGIDTIEELSDIGVNLTPRQRSHLEVQIDRGREFVEAFATQFVADKFGAATTHWSKLQDRVDRGVGNPCPLLLVGLPASIVDETA